MSYRIEISGGLFHLFNNSSRNITNLRKNIDYFFYIKIQQFYYIRFTLTLKNNSSNPFPNIFCHKLYNKDDYKINIGYNQSISSIINGDQLIISVSNNITNNSIYYINYKIKPLYNIDYIVSKIEIDDCFIDLIITNFPKQYTP